MCDHAKRWRRSHKGSVKVKSKPLPPPKRPWKEREEEEKEEEALEMKDFEENDEEEKEYYFEDPSNIGLMDISSVVGF